jgi:hypothetical protein
MLTSVHPAVRIFVQYHLSSVAFRRRRKACEKTTTGIRIHDVYYVLKNLVLWARIFILN